METASSAHEGGGTQDVRGRRKGRGKKRRSTGVKETGVGGGQRKKFPCQGQLRQTLDKTTSRTQQKRGKIVPKRETAGIAESERPSKKEKKSGARGEKGGSIGLRECKRRPGRQMANIGRKKKNRPALCGAQRLGTGKKEETQKERHKHARKRNLESKTSGRGNQVCQRKYT